MLELVKGLGLITSFLHAVTQPPLERVAPIAALLPCRRFLSVVALELGHSDD